MRKDDEDDDDDDDEEDDAEASMFVFEARFRQRVTVGSGSRFRGVVLLSGGCRGRRRRF